jgi:apolipoprotein N-acyltransferase
MYSRAVTADSLASPDGAAATALGPRAAIGLAALSGGLYVLALPGVDLWPFGFVALAPLVVALCGQTPARGAAVGFVSGFTMSVLGFHWLYGTLAVFGGLPAPAALAIMLLMCAYQGGRMTIAGWLTARAERRGWPAAPVFVLAHAATELAYPLLFPWYFAMSLHRVPVLWQVADLGGACLPGVVFLGPSLAIAEMVRARLERDRASVRLVAAGLFAPLLAAGYGAWRTRQVEAEERAAQAVVVGVVQGNQPLFGRTQGIGVHRRMTRALREQGAELVVWSEGAVPDVFDEAGYRDEVWRRVTRGLGVPVIFGAGVKRQEEGRTREFNTVLLADAEGRVAGRYDKHYLLPFGEYIPFGETFPSLYESSPNSGHLSPGDALDPVVWNGHPITVLVCYEDILPSYVRRAVRQGRPELLVNATIDTWFGRSIEPWEHLALAELRAVEHRRFLVRATNSGVSAIVDATGRVTRAGGMFDEEAFTGEVRLMSGSTVYEAIGDAPFWAGGAAVVAMAFLRRPRREDGAHARDRTR